MDIKFNPVFSPDLTHGRSHERTQADRGVNQDQVRQADKGQANNERLQKQAQIRSQQISKMEDGQSGSVVNVVANGKIDDAFKITGLKLDISV